ncbi:MAG: hypothetical protein H6574_08135 [Lewinellaceae bacterium]|nr:hypothetical protein [Saprospiraceae bacterium]MCB9331034.1 hypothetical protein [Lewinellaceae bacterium]
MKKYFLGVLAIGFLAVFACSKKDGQIYFKLDTPFTMGYLEQASLESDPDNVKIQFNKVLDDSRCPIDAICVWAGRVEFEITFTQAGSTESAILLLGDPTGSDYSDSATFGEYTVKVLQVKPDPKSNVVIPQSAYLVQLEVSKAP